MLHLVVGRWFALGSPPDRIAVSGCIDPKLRSALNETESFPDDDGTVTRPQPFRFLALAKGVARRGVDGTGGRKKACKSC